MSLTVYQNIVIHSLKVGTVTNASVLQIGTAGIVKSLSNVFNTSGFAAPAPLPEQQKLPPLVPLPSPQA